MPGGTFSKSARPVLPGSYTNFEAVPTVQVPTAIGSIVALPFTSDWGPLNQAVQIGSLAQFKSIYGDSLDTPGYIAAKQVFQGEGVDGRGGAGAIVAYRMGAASAAKATVDLNNTSAAAALTLTAKYEGTKGNDLTVTVQDYAADSSQTEILVYDGALELERFRFPDTDIQAAADAINARSGYFTATVGSTAAALATVANKAVAGGTDGTPLTGTDWTNMMNALDIERFGILAPYDLTDDTVLASLVAWTKHQNASGERFMTVVGGAADETIDDALTRAASIDDPNFVTVGVGSVEDTDLGVLSTSQFAPRVAGALANRGEGMSLTYARFIGVSIIDGPTTDEAVLAYDGGVVVLGRDSNITAPVRVEVGVTTFTSDSPDMPVAVFGDPKFVRTMEVFEMEIAEYVDANVIGKLPVNQKTREAIIGEMQSRLRAREDAGVIQPGWTVGVDQDPAPTDDDKFVALLYGIKFGRSVEQVFNRILVG